MDLPEHLATNFPLVATGKRGEMFSRRQARENMQLTPSEGSEGKHIFAAYARETMHSMISAGKHAAAA